MALPAKHFDAIAGRYDKAHPEHITTHYLRKRVALLGPLLQGGQALDVGCGTGRLMAALSRYGRVTGIEPSAGMLEVLREKKRGQAKQGSATALPFKDECFDLVYCVAVLHHLADPGKVSAALQEMVRVTKEGGHLVVIDHNPLNPYWPIAMRRAPQDTGDERLIPPAEILGSLKRASAQTASVRRSGLVAEFVPAALMPVARGIEWVVERLPVARMFCAHNVIIARKGLSETGAAPDAAPVHEAF